MSARLRTVEARTRDRAMDARPARDSTRWFYVWLAGACSLIAFGGFTPTYWLQLASGTFLGSPLLHLHALLFSAWTLLFFLQTIFAARGWLNRHCALGLAGVSVATAMVFVGCAVANEALAKRLAAGLGDSARGFHIAAMSMIVLFGGLVLAAIASVQRPDTHKRLMLLATISVIPPAIARVFFAVNVGIAPGLRPGLGPVRTVESVLAPALIADAFVLAGMIHDWRTRGRPHRAYVIGAVIMVVVQIIRVPVSRTQWWHAIADLLARSSG